MSYTTEENLELLENIRKPETFIRITAWGYGAEMAWCPISEKCAEWWNETKEDDISADEYMADAEEFRKKHDIPQEADFLWDSEYEQHSQWYESPNEELHTHGVVTGNANITIEEVDSAEYNSKILNTICENVNYEELYDEHEIDSTINDEYAVLPKGWYAQMISHEKGTFFDGILHLKGEQFDIKKLVIHEMELPNGECVIEKITYGEKEIEVDNQGGDTNGKGYSCYFYEETYEPAKH